VVLLIYSRLKECTAILNNNNNNNNNNKSLYYILLLHFFSNKQWANKSIYEAIEIVSNLFCDRHISNTPVVLHCNNVLACAYERTEFIYVFLNIIYNHYIWKPSPVNYMD